MAGFHQCCQATNACPRFPLKICPRVTNAAVRFPSEVCPLETNTCAGVCLKIYNVGVSPKWNTGPTATGYGNIPCGLMFLVYTFCLKKHYWLSLSTPQDLRVPVYGNNGLLPLCLMPWPDLRQVALSLWFSSNSDILELDQASDRICHRDPSWAM
jgi:hypothetical protein